MIPFCKPHIAPAQLAYVQEAMESGELSGDGPFGRRAEALLGGLVGSQVLLTGSCTSALEMAALLLDIGPGDEVIVPAYTFVSTANAFVLRGASIVFADSDSTTLSISCATVEALITDRTRAVVAVHYAGIPTDLSDLADLCSDRGVVLIEDAAHAVFGTVGDRAMGSFGALATLSFHQTKNVSCGEGGALVISEPSLVERAHIIREKGTNRHAFFQNKVDKYSWVDVGSSYLASEFQSAVLSAQLEYAPVTQERRLTLWDRYYRGLRDAALRSGVQLPTVPNGVSHPAHLFWLLLPSTIDRKSMISDLIARGVGATFHYQALHRSPYGLQSLGRGRDLPVAERAEEKLLRLPLFFGLSDRDQDHVIASVLEVMKC
jgi:dTDP-4-amino-4,6-dideoxygalactose transaminase